MAVAIGVSTLAAALVRPQASPVSAVGGVFVDRTPAALRGFAVHHFGTHGRTVLLLGMYAMLALVAILIGGRPGGPPPSAWPPSGRSACSPPSSPMTRPERHVTDVAPRSSAAWPA